MRLPELLTGHTPSPPPGPSELRRRRRVVAITIVVGTSLLAATLHVERGSGRFTALGFLLAATWIVGALLSGPIPVRLERAPGPTALSAMAIGAAAFVVFLTADVVGQHLPVISGALHSVLAKADAGSLLVVIGIALVNGVAEELFFRGAVEAAVGTRAPEVLSVVVYVAVTAATGNLALVIAALVMGAVFTLERRSSGSVLAPVVTHLTWSTLMILALPR